MTQPTEKIYRRPLPYPNVSLITTEGFKKIKKALATDYADLFLLLICQFRTQDDPTFCGLGTLVMVLNTLGVDPMRLWKWPWKWFHETMLNCCVSLEDVKKNGIHLHQFASLANCNRLTTTVHHANQSPESVSQFRTKLIQSVKGTTTVIVANYDREVLKQTGNGHFSPLAAYHPETDEVLIMDVARFKYPPHWVKVELLHEAMLSIDDSTKLPRGFVELEFNEDRIPFSKCPNMPKDANTGTSRAEELDQNCFDEALRFAIQDYCNLPSLSWDDCDDIDQQIRDRYPSELAGHILADFYRSQLEKVKPRKEKIEKSPAMERPVGTVDQTSNAKCNVEATKLDSTMSNLKTNDITRANRCRSLDDLNKKKHSTPTDRKTHKRLLSVENLARSTEIDLVCEIISSAKIEQPKKQLLPPVGNECKPVDNEMNTKKVELGENGRECKSNENTKYEEGSSNGPAEPIISIDEQRDQFHCRFNCHRHHKDCSNKCHDIPEANTEPFCPISWTVQNPITRNVITNNSEIDDSLTSFHS